MPSWLGQWNFLSFILIALVAGSSFVSQSLANAQLRTNWGSAYWAAFVSYLGGTIVMAIVLLLTRSPLPKVEDFSRTPWSSFSGGLFGAIYILIMIYLIPRLGSGTAVALFISGQLLASVVFDHFGWFGLAAHPLDFSRVCGVGLLIAGVLLIRR